MFKFLKEKLKQAVSKFTRNVTEEVETKIEKKEDVVEEQVKEPVKEQKIEERKAEIKKPEVKREEKKAEIKKEEKRVEEKKPEAKKVEKRIEEKKERLIEEKRPEAKREERIIEEKKEKLIEAKKPEITKAEIKKPEEKKGFFKRLTETVTKTSLSEEKFEGIFWELEVALMESNVAIEVIEKIKDDLKRELVESKISRLGIDEIVKNTLEKSIRDLFDVGSIDVVKKIKDKKGKPYVIVFVGINGVGKTTTLAKIANYLKKKGLGVVIAAADTFRVAAIEQIEVHADKLGIKLVKQEYGSDSAAVCYDAIMHAKAKDMDVVLIDTAGRSNANVNLMDELKKVVRVAKPDLVLFIGDSLTGNDAVEQAKEFQESIGIDGIVLAKADVDEKGGCAVSISYVTKKPIIFLGVGQRYDDLKEFSPDLVLGNLGIAGE